MARKGFLKDKCGPRPKTFEHHCYKTSLMLVIAPFANLVDLDEIFNWLSTTGIRHFVNRNCISWHL